MKIEMRSRCRRCHSYVGYVKTKNGQDVVTCECGKYAYCAPKTETGREVRTLKTTHKQINTKQRARIIERANRNCESCGKTQCQLDVGHVVSVKSGHKHGLSDAIINSDENLIAQCPECNSGWSSRTLPIRMYVNILMARTTENELRKNSGGT